MPIAVIGGEVHSVCTTPSTVRRQPERATSMAALRVLLTRIRLLILTSFLMLAHTLTLEFNTDHVALQPVEYDSK